jgi:hypothetical protein
MNKVKNATNSERILKILLTLSTGVLGIFFGTQLTEAVLIVPYWQDMSADEFFVLYKTYGKQIQQFYTPLTIVATILPIVTLIFSIIRNLRISIEMWMMSIFTILFFSTFFIYFKEANNSFMERTISNEALPKELLTWSYWHWGRVVCESFAFIFGIILTLRLREPSV